LLAGKGFLGLGVLEQGLVGSTLHIETYHDDPSRGAVVFSTALIAATDLVMYTADSVHQPDKTLVFFDAAWLPYAFGLQTYDPFESIKASLYKAHEHESGTATMQTGLALALWSAMEGDLFRFAYDAGFTAELEKDKGTQEWRRFARLNDLYRSIIKAIVPSGINPANWTAWLRNSGQSIQPPSRLAGLQVRLLTRHIDSIVPALVKAAPTDAIFVFPSSAIMHIAD